MYHMFHHPPHPPCNLFMFCVMDLGLVVLVEESPSHPSALCAKLVKPNKPCPQTLNSKHCTQRLCETWYVCLGLKIPPAHYSFVTLYPKKLTIHSFPSHVSGHGHDSTGMVMLDSWGSLLFTESSLSPCACMNSHMKLVNSPVYFGCRIPLPASPQGKWQPSQGCPTLENKTLCI